MIGDIIICVVVIGIIAAGVFFTRDTKKNGIHTCSMGCRSCPHPCRGERADKDKLKK